MWDANGDVYLPGPQRATDMKADMGMMGTLSSVQRGKKKRSYQRTPVFKVPERKTNQEACVVGSQKEEVQGVWSDEAEQ